MTDDEWWDAFIFMAVAKGEERSEVETAVRNFRSAQQALTNEMAKRK